MAHMVLAGFAGSPMERLVLLREAVRIGQRQWEPVAEAHGVAWWSEPGTQPYMRAIAAYGRALAARGQSDAARECFEILLEMAPDDPLRGAPEMDLERENGRERGFGG